MYQKRRQQNWDNRKIDEKEIKKFRRPSIPIEGANRFLGNSRSN